MRWDDVAIRRNAKDQRATMYAVVIWLAAIFLFLCLSTWPYWFTTPVAAGNPSKLILVLATGVIFMFVVLAIVTLVQLSLCHLDR